MASRIAMTDYQLTWKHDQVWSVPTFACTNKLKKFERHVNFICAKHPKLDSSKSKTVVAKPDPEAHFFLQNRKTSVFQLQLTYASCGVNFHPRGCHISKVLNCLVQKGEDSCFLSASNPQRYFQIKGPQSPSSTSSSSVTCGLAATVGAVACAFRSFLEAMYLSTYRIYCGWAQGKGRLSNI